MKIGIIAPYDVLNSNNGASIRVYELAKNLNDNGASVYVLHHGQTKSFRPNFKFIHFKSFNPIPGSSNYLHPLNVTYYVALIRYLKDFQPDIIQCEQPWSTIPTLFIARRFGIPCVLDEHNVEYLWSLQSSRTPFLSHFTCLLESYACSFSSLILATSQVDKIKIARLFNLPEERIIVIPNGVDNTRFSQKPLSINNLRKKLNLDPDKKFVLFHGTLDARQNYEAASLIIDFIAPKVNDAIFIIAGNRSPKWLKEKATHQKNVIILGYIPKIEEYIFASDICIAPITIGSGTRLKLLEYLAAGKTIVSTVKAAEGIKIIDSVHAFLFKDVNQRFVECVQKLIKGQLSFEVRDNAEKLASDYDWSFVGGRLYNLYRQILR